MRYLYPIIAILIIGIGSGEISNIERRYKLVSVSFRNEVTQGAMQVMSVHLKECARSTGHYPTNDQGLLVVKNIVNKCGESSNDVCLSHCRAAKSGILSVWGDPFIYENRRGINAAQFKGLDAAQDERSPHSYIVDHDIYLRCIGAEQAQANYDYWQPRLTAAGYCVWSIAAVLFILFIGQVIRVINSENTPPGKFWTGARSIAASILGAAIVGSIIFPIYATTGSINRQRTPELTKDYITLISKYHDRGIIGDRAYQKILAGLKNE